MHKTVILLAKSAKKLHYCVAGIDNQTGEWIRIISNKPHIQHAVTVDDMRYEDETDPKLLDIIKITCKEHCPNYYQQENYIFDDSFYWEKVGQATFQRVISLHPLEQESYIFYNSERYVTEEFIKQLPISQCRSLTIIKPRNVVLSVKHWPERVTVQASFEYEGKYYNDISVKDPEYEIPFKQYADGNYSLNNQKAFVLSLADPYQKGNSIYHYKIVATII
ncbi:MAG: hypothetical protein ABFD50_04010 [Smithella sp.]